MKGYRQVLDGQRSKLMDEQLQMAAQVYRGSA